MSRRARDRLWSTRSVLNINSFWSLAQARVVIADWNEDYNTRRRVVRMRVKRLARRDAPIPAADPVDDETAYSSAACSQAKFAPGDEVFGQLLIPPLGSTGMYAEYVAVTEDAPLGN